MLSTLIVFGAGYVLGSKAGRERYNQIVALVQEAASRLDQYGARGWLPAEVTSDDYLTGRRSGARTRRR